MERLKIVTIALGLLVSLSLGACAIHAGETFTIGNNPPELSHPPVRYEIDPSSGYAETYTYSATGVDPNGESFVLLVCSTPEIVMGPEGFFCEADVICESEPSASGTEASCFPGIDSDISQDDWFVFICDTNRVQMCSQPWNGNLSARQQADWRGDVDTSADVLGAATNSGLENSTLPPTTSIVAILTVIVFTVAAVVYVALKMRKDPLSKRILAFTILAITAGALLLALLTITHEKEVPTEAITILGEKTEDITELPKTSTISELPGPKVGLYAIYESPDVNAPIVLYAEEDDTFSVVSTTEDWVEVLLPHGGTGWIPRSNEK